jgi:hypothetical protein
MPKKLKRSLAMKSLSKKENKKWLKPRSIRFDAAKLKKAKKHKVIDQLSVMCREQLDILVKDLK